MTRSSSNSTAANTRCARRRTRGAPRSLGYLVLRYWNNDVMANIEGAIEDIAAMLESHGLEPAPSQQNAQHHR